MVKLGIIGMSEGNGHPFSWSCIVNGVVPAQTKDFEYPGITSYLSKNKNECIPFRNSKVVSVWCDNIEDSQKICSFSRVSQISNTLKDLVDGVDAVLLARDDSHNHLKFAKYCISEGKPIFIDKPISTSVKGLNNILDISKYDHQIFSCSALRYDPDLNFKSLENEVGTIKKIVCYTNKPWDTYSVHLIQPLVYHFNIKGVSSIKKTILGIKFTHGNIDFEVNCDVTDVRGLFFEVIGSKFTKLIKFNNSFISFRESLRNFISQIECGKVLIPPQETLEVVKLIEVGK